MLALIVLNQVLNERKVRLGESAERWRFIFLFIHGLGPEHVLLTIVLQVKHVVSAVAPVILRTWQPLTH